MARFDRFELVLRPPHALRTANALLHVVLAAFLAGALIQQLEPQLALWASVCLLIVHALYEDRGLRQDPRRLRVEEDQLWLDGEIEQPWRLRRVTCATRSLMLAELTVADASRGPSKWLRVSLGQLDERDARRLLRWLRAGVPDQRRRAPARGQSKAELSAAGVSIVSRASARRPG